VHHKCKDGLPEAVAFTEDIESEQTDETGEQNADDPWYPEKKIR
jgi:hypothetical protein